MSYPADPNRDEMQVLGDYVFNYQRHLVTEDEHLVDQLYLILFKALSSPQLRMTPLLLSRLRGSGSRPARDPEPVTALRVELQVESLKWDEPMIALTGSAHPTWDRIDLKDVRPRWVAMRRATAERIMREQSHHLEVARCSECGRVLNTPLARQCFVCGHDWH